VTEQETVGDQRRSRRYGGIPETCSQQISSKNSQPGEGKKAWKFEGGREREREDSGGWSLNGSGSERRDYPIC
jgi:hypothetical protein